MTKQKSHKLNWADELAVAGLGLGPTAVGLALWHYANPDGSRVFPGSQRVAENIGVGRKAVEGHIRTLVDKGWLQVVKNANPTRKTATVYQLTIPTGLRVTVDITTADEPEQDIDVDDVAPAPEPEPAPARTFVGPGGVVFEDNPPEW